MSTEAPPFPTESFAEMEPDNGPHAHVRALIFGADHVLTQNTGDRVLERAGWRLAEALGEVLGQLPEPDQAQIRVRLENARKRGRRIREKQCILCGHGPEIEPEEAVKIGNGWAHYGCYHYGSAG